MKLNLHPKEFLAVYNLLNSCASDCADYVHIQEARNRMRSYLLSALSKKETDTPDDVLFALWEKTQNEKINNLKKQNKELDPRNIFSFQEDPDEQSENMSSRPPMPVVPRVGKTKVNKMLLGDDRFRHYTELRISRSGCTRIPVKNPCEQQLQTTTLQLLSP